MIVSIRTQNPALYVSHDMSRVKVRATHDMFSNVLATFSLVTVSLRLMYATARPGLKCMSLMTRCC